VSAKHARQELGPSRAGINNVGLNWGRRGGRMSGRRFIRWGKRKRHRNLEGQFRDGGKRRPVWVGRIVTVLGKIRRAFQKAS